MLNSYFRKTKEFILSHPTLATFLTFSFFFTLFFSVYFSVSTLSSSDDHFFHFRFAQGMWDSGLFGSFEHFKAIYFSTHAQTGDYYIYYNFLFFLAIMPFALIQPLFLGIKLYAVFAVSGAFTLLYWCLRRLSIANPFIWTLVIIAVTSDASLWRFFLSRPYALAPSLLILLIVFLYRKQYIAVGAVSFLYLFWHSSTFFLPACVAIAYYVIEFFYHEKGDWKNLIAAVGGTAVAVGFSYLIAPGFLLFIKETVFSIYWETIIGKAVHINEGGELYPVDFFNFIQRNAIVFSIFIVALAVDIYSYVSYRLKKSSENDYFAGLPTARRYLQTSVLALTACFFLGTISASGRFGDYFTMFAGLYVALSFDYVRRVIVISGPAIIRRSVIIGLSIVLVYLIASNMLFLQRRIALAARSDEFYQVGKWLADNSKPGDIVFEANWSWFPQLYYQSPKNYYSMGLEPRFTYNYNPELYWLAAKMPYGIICTTDECPDQEALLQNALKRGGDLDGYVKLQGARMADILVNRFHAAYVVSSTDHRIFNYIMEHDPHFKLVIYNEAYGNYLFKLVPATTTPTKK